MGDDLMDDERRCVATSKQSGDRCKRFAIPGGTVCAMHGGKSPQVADAAQRRLAERQALKDLESFGIPIVVDPHTALLEELHRTAGAVAWLGALVAGLDQGDVVWGTTKVKDGGDDAGTTQEAKPNIWYELWARERKHLLEVAKACVAAGIEERRIALAEGHGRLLAAVVSQVLDGLELSKRQQALVPSVVPAAFRQVAALEAGTS